MIINKFEMPDDIIIDPVSGYSVNVPLEYQGAPFWWEDEPEIVNRITLIRNALGITVDDFPSGVPIRQDSFKVLSMDEVLEAKKAKRAKENNQ